MRVPAAGVHDLVMWSWMALFSGFAHKMAAAALARSIAVD